MQEREFGGLSHTARRRLKDIAQSYHQPAKWLFGGIFEVIERDPTGNTVVLIDAYKEYIGRLLVHYPGPAVRGRAFYLDKHFDELKVAQILERPFEGEAFCGYEQVEHSFSQLEAIIKQGKSDWKAALENVKGIYLIVDKQWQDVRGFCLWGFRHMVSLGLYIGIGHGWNDQLTKVIAAKGLKYARENLQFSILEFRSMRTDDKAIIEREEYWKRALLSCQFGYNNT
jgi:hypothetical protein